MYCLCIIHLVPGFLYFLSNTSGQVAKRFNRMVISMLEFFWIFFSSHLYIISFDPYSKCQSNNCTQIESSQEENINRGKPTTIRCTQEKSQCVFSLGCVVQVAKVARYKKISLGVYTYTPIIYLQWYTWRIIQKIRIFSQKNLCVVNTEHTSINIHKKHCWLAKLFFHLSLPPTVNQTSQGSQKQGNHQGKNNMCITFCLEPAPEFISISLLCHWCCFIYKKVFSSFPLISITQGKHA